MRREGIAPRARKRSSSRPGSAPETGALLLAESSPEWRAVCLAAQLPRAEPAALFASLAAGPVESMARRARPLAALVSTAAQWQKLARAAADLGRDGLAAVISAEPLPPGSP